MSTASISESRTTHSRIPGPPATPMLGWRGNMLPLLREPVGYMLWLHRTYGDVVTMARGSNDFVFVFSPEYNHQLLSNQSLFYNGEINAPGSVVKIPPGSAALRLFSGITTMNADKHTQQRRLLMPAFHKKRIEALRDRMLTLTEAHRAGWKVGDSIDLLREMKSLTLAVAVQTILGLDPARGGDRVRATMERWLRLALSFGVVALPFNLPGLPFGRMLRLAESLDGEIHGMIARRRGDDLPEGDGSDALSMLLAAHDEDGTRLTDDELVGQTTALFIAGHETTASALTWTLFLLAQHPQVLQALLDELDGTLHGGAPTVEQVQHSLPILDAVIKESMRLLPPGLWFLRVAQAPVRLGPYSIPQGTRVLWTPTVTHRLPRLYPEPSAFKPERWQTINPSPYEYLPFGAGPRRCLGAVFAVMEMKLVLPAILQRFRLSLPDNVRIDLAGSPLATPKGGMPMHIGSVEEPLTKSRVRGSIRRLVDLQ